MNLMHPFDYKLEEEVFIPQMRLRVHMLQHQVEVQVWASLVDHLPDAATFQETLLADRVVQVHKSLKIWNKWHLVLEIEITLQQVHPQFKGLMWTKMLNMAVVPIQMVPMQMMQVLETGPLPQ